MKIEISQIDADYEPEPMETRTIFGVKLRQKRNDGAISENLLKNVATEKKEVGQDNYRTRCNYFRQSSDTF
jgi:phosphoribosylaminoimidazolecarboxamide formyltransferase/IMP cyclohydrolase